MGIHINVEAKGIYFITFTCHSWLKLIDITNSYDLVYKWFDVLSSKDHAIVGYVIMPNHIHLLLYYNGGKQNLNKIIGNGKRFMAYGIVDRLKAMKKYRLLEKLALDVSSKDKAKGQKHEVWQDSFDVKHCRTEKFILQKLNYMHWNPCADTWKICEHPYDYLHSSASFYELGKPSYLLLRDYRDLLSYLED